MEALLNIPNPTNHLISSRCFTDSLENHICGLEALGKPQESYGDILVAIIHKKLPLEIKKTLARQNSNKEWTLEEIRKALIKEVDILEAGQSSFDVCYFDNPIPISATATAAFFSSSKQYSTTGL
jgi:hypothetical protein